MKISVFLSLLLFAVFSYAQSCFEKPVELNQKIATSKFVVDAAVVAHEFLKDNQQRKYIVYTLELWKVWKGTIAADTILITASVNSSGNDILDNENDIPSFSIGTKGIFFLNANTLQFTGKYTSKKSFHLSDASQGYILFEKKTGKFQTFKKEYNSYTELSALVSRQTNIAPKIKKNKTFSTVSGLSIVAAGGPNITSIFPLSVPAGIDSVLEIRGTGFGDTQGDNYVEFQLCSDAPPHRGRALNSDYILWSDSLIKVQVPGITVGLATDITSAKTAGTGSISVHIGGLSDTSTETLFVPFSILNIAHTPAADAEIIKKKSFPIELFNQNNNGGYTFQFNQHLAEPAKSIFTKALNSWKCQAGINWNISESSSVIDTFKTDNISIVAFNTFSSSNTLGAAKLNGLNICPNTLSGEVRANELDVIFNNAKVFNFSTAFPAAN